MHLRPVSHRIRACVAVQFAIIQTEMLFTVLLLLIATATMFGECAEVETRQGTIEILAVDLTGQPIPIQEIEYFRLGSRVEEITTKSPNNPLYVWRVQASSSGAGVQVRMARYCCRSTADNHSA